jgi:putative DNA primase/helicase
MTAESIAKALGGRKAGAAWMARCPAHNDRDPSLSIQDANDCKVLVRCHAGCGQAQVIAKLRSRGLWEDNSHRQRDFIRQQPRLSANDQPDRDDAKRTEAALAIWQATAPAGNTLVESYLVSRGLRLPPPPTLRFHAGLKHPSGGIWPAMVALVTRGTDGAPLAIHRTYLARDGTSKAPIEPAKMMLGPCRGGAVRLGPITDRLLVAEGIESALSAMQATGQAAWAHSRHPGCARSNCRWRLAMSLCLPMATSPARRQRTTRRGAGNEEGGAFASPAHREGLISTTCFWAAPSVTWRERHDLRDREPDRQRHRERRGNL